MLHNNSLVRCLVVELCQNPINYNCIGSSMNNFGGGITCCFEGKLKTGFVFCLSKLKHVVSKMFRYEVANKKVFSLPLTMFMITLWDIFRAGACACLDLILCIIWLTIIDIYICGMDDPTLKLVFNANTHCYFSMLEPC